VVTARHGGAFCHRATTFMPTLLWRAEHLRASWTLSERWAVLCAALSLSGGASALGARGFFIRRPRLTPAGACSSWRRRSFLHIGSERGDGRQAGTACAGTLRTCSSAVISTLRCLRRLRCHAAAGKRRLRRQTVWRPAGCGRRGATRWRLTTIDASSATLTMRHMSVSRMCLRCLFRFPLDFVSIFSLRALPSPSLAIAAAGDVRWKVSGL